MGVFQQAIEPLQERFQELGTGSQVGVSFVAFIFLAVVLNVLKQLFFSNPNEPPMVFHVFPLIGSTVEYGMDPPRFFKKMRAKVGGHEKKKKKNPHRLRRAMMKKAQKEDFP